MKYKHIFLNPFYWYSLIWAVVLILYNFQWSGLYLSLDKGVLLFFFATIIISLILGKFYSNFIKKHKSVYTRPKHLRAGLFAIIIGYIADFAYEKHIPLVSVLTRSTFTYKDFSGIPFIHVLLVTFSLFFTVYLFYCLLNDSEKQCRRKCVWYLVIINCLLILLYNRAVIIMEIFMCALIFLSCRKKLKLKHFVLAVVAAIIVLFGFGVLGNIRSGSSWNNTDYIIEIAKIDLNRYPSFIPKEFVWAYVYLISPLGNLNQFVIDNGGSSDLMGVLYCIIPDAISKRILPQYDGGIDLVTPYLTVSTGFASVYKYGGLTGMWFMYVTLALFVLVIGWLSKHKTNSFITTNSILCCVVIFMFFDNFISYTGLTFCLVFSIGLALRWKPTSRYASLSCFPKGGIQNQKSLTKNSIFFLVYNVLNVLFPFITGVYVARVLMPADIGQVAYAQNIAQYFVILAFLGIPTYGLREISKVRNNKSELNKVHSELFFINLISTFVFTCLYLILIFAVPGFRQHLPLYLIAGLLIVLNALDNSWLYEGLEEFGFISLRNIIFKILAFVLLVIFVRGTGDYLIYAAITVIGTAGNYILNILHSRKFVKFKVRGLNFKRHLKPIVLLVVVNLAIEIYTLVDTTMLGIFCEKETVAFYSYGSKINKIFLQIINTFTMVLVPRISLYYKEGKIDEFNALLAKTLKIILILAIPMIVGIQFVSEFIICKLYGDVYINSAYVLRILSAALLISPIGYLLGSRVLLVSGHEFKMVISVGVGAVVNIIGNLILIRYLNEYGAAIASVISEIVVMTIYVIQGRKFYRLQNIWGTVLKVVISSVLMGGYLFACSFIPINGWGIFSIQVVGAVIIYFLILILAKEQTVCNYSDKILKRFIKNGKINAEADSN